MADPEQFGRYTVKRVLGRGAMGLVYLAEDPTIGREVAIKVILMPPAVTDEERAEIQERFEREFRSAGNLSHPNIVTVHDVGQSDENSFIAMEFVPGSGLDKLIKSEEAMSFKDVSDLISEICAGLDYAHERGIVHRDIKPANILLTDQRIAKITDFGVAKLASTTITRTGSIIGTPAYMSPEQVRGIPATPAADQFSVAIIAFQMLTRVLPFNAENPTSIMYRIVHEQPPDPREANGLVPEAACAVLMKGLSKDPEERYTNCTEFADALRAALGGAPIPAALEGTVAYGLGTMTPAPQTKAPGVTGSSSNRWMGYAAVIVAIAAAGIAYNFGYLDGIVATITGGPTPPPLALMDHSLSIEAPEGGAVWVNGEDVGVPTTGVATPATVALSGFPDDEIVVELRFADITRATTTFTMAEAPPSWVPAGLDGLGPAPDEPEENLVDPLPPEPLFIAVLSDPDGATVILDGTPQPGVTPLQLELMPNRLYDVGVELSGYEPQSVQDIDPSALTPPQLNFPNLVRDTPPGTIDFSAAGYAYTIEVDDTAVTPDAATRQLQLTEGAYSVIVSASEVFYRETQQIELSSDEIFLWSFPPAFTILMRAPGFDTCRGLIDGTEVGILPMEIPIAGGTYLFGFECERRGSSQERHEVNREDQIIERPRETSR